MPCSVIWYVLDNKVAYSNVNVFIENALLSGQCLPMGYMLQSGTYIPVPWTKCFQTVMYTVGWWFNNLIAT